VADVGCATVADVGWATVADVGWATVADVGWAAVADVGRLIDTLVEAAGQLAIAVEPTGHTAPVAQMKLPEATPVQGEQPTVVLHESQLLFVEHASHVSPELPPVQVATVVL